MPLFKHLVEHNRMVLIGLCCTKSSMAEEEQGPVSQISSRPSRMQSPMRSFGRTCRWPTWQPSSVKKTSDLRWGQFHSVPLLGDAISKLCQSYVKTWEIQESIKNLKNLKTPQSPKSPRLSQHVSTSTLRNEPLAVGACYWQPSTTPSTRT